MTYVEEVDGCIINDKKMDSVSEAVEELLTSAQTHNCLTTGVYESAQLMNVDPDSVLLCILATDEEDEEDIALQIHFTLIQAFCYENNVNILRVSGLMRLEQLLLVEGGFTSSSSTIDNNNNANQQPRDLHCLLVTNPQCQSVDLQKALQSINNYCEESRSQEQWVPHLALLETQDSEISGETTDKVEVELVSDKIAVCLSVG